MAAEEPVIASQPIGEDPALAPAEVKVTAALAPRPQTATSRREGDLAMGVGRRKTAIARVTIKPGLGRMLINGRDAKEYFRRMKLIDEIQQPFTATGTVKRFDTDVNVTGSSLAGQAGAVRLGISRALAAWQDDMRPPLATAGLLTRDPRMVERKKYGIRGARRRPQWTKR